ncbi:MAG: hypothetical protein Kow0092_01730 [Deferrisomatales bacterium]
MKTTRRGFLRKVGAGTAGTWLVPLVPWKALAQDSIRKPFDPRLKRQFLSVCRQCPQGCGVRAEVVEGKVKKLRGNPLHPANRGALCARGVSALHLYYNPDRIRTPLRRRGERGEGQWEPVGWDEALTLLRDRLMALRGEGKGARFAWLSEQMTGVEEILARRFCEAYGTPNFLDLGQYPTRPPVTAATVMQGVEEPVTFDLARASYVLSFNVPFLESARNPVQTWKGFAEFRAGKGHPRGRFIHFSPVRDLTAAKADEWIPVRPGTEGAVALGMAYVMLQEGLYDHEFVKYRCHGFEGWRRDGEDFPGFYEHVRRNYKPAQVSEVTGVPVDKIVGLAREFALAPAPLALWQDQVGIASQPLHTQMAVHSLNALVGNIDAPGGVLVPRSLPRDFTPEATRDAVAKAGLAKGPVVDARFAGYPVADAVPEVFPERVLAGAPYPVDAVLLYRTNPVFDKINGSAFREALLKVPFSVAVASIHNDTTKWCDLVLPESHALESWCAGLGFIDAGYPFFNLAEPVVEPRYDTRHVGQAILDLARRCGGTVAASLPWARFQDAAFAYLGQLNGLKSGDVFGRPYEEIWTRLLERIGWRARGAVTDEQLWHDGLASGGWWDPIYFHREWGRSLRTESGRFEFFATRLWQRLHAPGSGPGPDKVEALPHYPEADKGEDADFPFALVVRALPHLQQVESPNQPWLQEICGDREREHWVTWLDINPEEAEHHHLLPGQKVVVESPRGQIEVRCRFDHGVQPGTVRVSFGLGHEDGGRWMKGIGVSPLGVVAPARDARVGTPNWQTTRVRVRKA